MVPLLTRFPVGIFEGVSRLLPLRDVEWCSCAVRGGALASVPSDVRLLAVALSAVPPRAGQ